MLAFTSASAKGYKKQNVYMFGFSASFNDSIVYFTPVQEVEAYIANDRTRFLASREQYSYQLKNYFDRRGQLHRTCITIFDTDKDKAEKKYEKMKEKYTTKSKNKFDVTYLTDDDFKFTTETPEDGTVYVNSEEAERAAKEDMKETQKEEKKENHQKSKKAKKSKKQ